MHYSRYFIILIMFIIPFCVFGQTKSYTLNGHMHVMNGDSYPYQLTVHISGEKVDGYSVTSFPDGTKQKITVKGNLDREKQVLIISETKVAGNIPDAYACLIDATLSYKLNGTKYYFSGTFTGKNQLHRLCGTGTCEFEPINISDDMLKKDTVKASRSIKSLKSQKDALAAGKLSAISYEITAGVLKEFEWANDSVVIAVWDAGIIDGDIITILFNDKEMLHNYRLTPDKIQLKFPVTQAANTITVVADDEGSIPPNTTEILLYDGDKKYYITAYNKKGGRSVIILNKR
jgi:hypothetical protein